MSKDMKSDMELSKYKILPVKIEKKISENWKDVDSYLPIHPFAILASAPPRSGKSNLIVNMLINPAFDWINKFDKIVIISPSIMSDKTFKPIVEISEDDENPLSDKLKIFTGDDIEDMDALIKAIIAGQDEDMSKETLVILDDCIGKLKNGLFGKTFARYRHKNMSLLAVSQMFKAFDVISRSCASGLMLFKTHNDKERIKILEELAGFPDAADYFDEATDEKHSFLWVNNEAGELWKNFDELLYKK
jgi:hypothetical protein